MPLALPYYFQSFKTVMDDYEIEYTGSKEKFEYIYDLFKPFFDRQEIFIAGGAVGKLITKRPLENSDIDIFSTNTTVRNDLKKYLNKILKDNENIILRKRTPFALSYEVLDKNILFQIISSVYSFPCEGITQLGEEKISDLANIEFIKRVITVLEGFDFWHCQVAMNFSVMILSKNAKEALRLKILNNCSLRSNIAFYRLRKFLEQEYKIGFHLRNSMCCSAFDDTYDTYDPAAEEEGYDGQASFYFNNDNPALNSIELQ